MPMILNTKSPQVLAGFLAAHRDRLLVQDPEVAGRVEEKQMRDRIMADRGYHVVGVPHMPDVTLSAVHAHTGAAVSVVEIDPEQNLLEAAAWLREHSRETDLVIVKKLEEPGLYEVASCEPKMYKRWREPFIEEISENFVIPDIRFKKDRSPNKGLRIGSYNSKSRKR